MVQLNPRVEYHALVLFFKSTVYNVYHTSPGSSDGKASAYNVGDLGSIPGSGRSPGEGNSNPLQYSCLENPMDGEAWWATYSVFTVQLNPRVEYHALVLFLKSTVYNVY